MTAEKLVSLRIVLQGIPGFLVLVVLLITGCDTQRGAERGLLISGGTLITMNSGLSEAEAMFIRNDLIVAVGTREELEGRFPEALEYDLNGHVVLPGFIDSHTHVHELGYDLRKVDLTGSATVEEIIDRLRASSPDPEPGRWLIGSGWDDGEWANTGYPDRALLDEAFPDNPIWLESLHGFAGFCNGRALKIAGVDSNTPDPEPGRILRRSGGEPTGTLITSAQDLITDHIPTETLEEVKESIITGLEMMAREGVTSVHEAGLTRIQERAFRELAEEGRLPVRVYGMVRVTDGELLEEYFKRGPRIDRDAFFTVRSIKIFYDGSLGSRTALLRDPYSDRPDLANPTIEHPPEEFRSFLEQAAERGFQVVVHCIGDEASDRFLTEAEKILSKYPDLDHRWRNEHAQVVLSDYYRRAADLGLISSMQTSHAVLDMFWAEDRVGPLRIRHSYAWRRMLDAGVFTIFNSDLPAVPWAPVQTLYFGVTRMSLEGEPPGGWYPDQVLTVEETLYGMTMGSAYAAFQEEVLGSLEPGKFADFVELDRDPRTVRSLELKDLKVVGTWVAGRRIIVD